MAYRMAVARAKGEAITCPRCRQPITPDQQFDVGHSVDVALRPDLMWRTDLMAPEHRDCNRRAGQVRSQQVKTKNGARLWQW